MGARILLVGDIHLGRRPSRLWSVLDSGRDLTPSELGPIAAWRATVDLALRERVDAVVLAGDVVEAENAAFEAFGPLREGAERLVAGGVGLLAVAGNHDVEALPRLADAIPEMRLVGRDGTWEIATITRDGEPVAHVAGWSFTERVHATSPLSGARIPERPQDGLPYLGVAHVDLDAAGSRYAPVRRSELEGAGPDAWFLGHVHRPSDLSGTRPIGYLGSLVGLDPGENGPHGPWLLRHEGGATRVEHVPLAPLRWEPVAVPAAKLESPDDLLGAIVSAIDGLDGTIQRVEGAPRAVGCRIRLIGSTPIHRALGDALARLPLEDLTATRDGVLYFVEKCEDESGPALDLERLAAGDDPPALLARRLLALERRSADAAEMIAGARTDLRAALRDPWWLRLAPADLDDERIRALLLQEGRRALELLLAQGPASGGGGAGP